MSRNALLLVLLTLFGGLSLHAQNYQNAAVYFAVDSDELTSETHLLLHQLLDDISHLDRWELEILAHTDATGTNSYNDALAQRRAKAVQNYLLERGLPLAHVNIATFGENRPAQSNITEEGRSRNRRVEINLKTWALNDLQDLMAGLEGQKNQQFSFSNSQAITLTGAEGTTIWIPADAFVYQDGSSVTGEIELTMTEAYTYADMIAQGLSTHSGQEMLETGGMVYLQAVSSGQELKLKEGTELIVAMPSAQRQKEGMQLFTGELDENGKLANWAPTGQAYKKNKAAILRIADPPPMPKIKSELSFFKYDESGEPTPPNKPLAPVFPQEPKRENVKYNPGFFKKLSLGKKGILAREEEMYARKVAQYEARLEKYPIYKQAYEVDMEEYYLTLEAYKHAKAAWEAGLQEQWKVHLSKRSETYKAAVAEAEEKYRQTLQAYQEYKARKIAEYEAAVEMGDMDQRSLNNYFFAVNKMGWINCDRFYDLAASEKEPLLVKDGDEKEELIFVLFTDIRSALRTQRKADFYATQAVPKGAKAKVIGLKVADGRSMLAVKEITVGELDAVELEYESRPLAEIRETLAALN